MARKIGAKCKLCRREGIKLFLKGIRCSGDKCAIERRNYPPGPQRKMRKKLTNYGIQLREKQKMKKIYGMLEKQFRIFYDRAARKKGVTGENFIQLIERRLDNVVYRLLFVTSRTEARQMIFHGLVSVNGKKVDIPSYIINIGDTITISTKGETQARVKENLEMFKDRTVPEWIMLDRSDLTGRVVRLPLKADAGLPVEENLIVELYSK